MKQAKVSIIVLNYNGLSDTIECLKSLKNIKYPNYEIIAVDNASSDGSTIEIARLFPDIVFIRNKQNLGYAEGNNTGIRYALEHNSDFLLVLNNDTIVDPEILDNFIKASRLYPDTGIFGAKIYYYAEPQRLWFAGGEWDKKRKDFVHNGYNEYDTNGKYGAIKEIDYATGCALFFKREVVEAIGLFNPDFFLVFEETDWCWRAKKAGFRCLFVPDAKVWHKVSASFTGSLSPLYAYFYTRNKLLWAMRNLPNRERLQVYFRCAYETFFPHTADYDDDCRLSQKLYWDFSYNIKALSHPQLLARLIGLKDFMLRRFGKCPQSVYRLQREFKEQRAA